MKKEEGVIGSSTESHISHVLLTRRSLRLMGWSREGADKVSQVRIYWKNGKNMQKLVKLQKEEEKEASHEEENYLSASEILTWERKSSKANRKYIEALRGHKEKSVYNIRGCKKSCVYREIYFFDMNQICKKLLSDHVMFLLSNFLYSNSITSSFGYIHHFPFFCIPIRH